MTAHWYDPTGKTFDLKMQDILRRRERWLSETPTAAECMIVLHPSDRDSIGWWLSQQGVAWVVLKRGGPPTPGQVWYADAAEVEDMP